MAPTRMCAHSQTLLVITSLVTNGKATPQMRFVQTRPARGHRPSLSLPRGDASDGFSFRCSRAGVYTAFLPGAGGFGVVFLSRIVPFARTKLLSSPCVALNPS